MKAVIAVLATLTLLPGAAHSALKAGAPAPDFTLQASLGGQVFTFALADALKKGPVVLYFYPAAFTPGCTIEAHEFAAAIDQYKALGINAVSKPEAFQGLVTKLTTGDQTLEATIIGWSLGGDPDPYQIWHSSQIPDPAKSVTGFGFTYFKDPAMDKAIEQGRNPTDGNCSTAARKANYETFNKILNENQPYNFGYSNNVLAVSQKTLQSFDPGSFSTLYNVHQWWIKK